MQDPFRSHPALRHLPSLDRVGLLCILALAAHVAAVLAGGSQAKLLSYAALILFPLAAALACLRRGLRDRTVQGWAELALAMLLWAGGMAADASLDLLWPVGDIPGISVLFYVLYGVPLIFALASPVDEPYYVRMVDALMAIVLGGLFAAHTFSFASFDRATPDGVEAIRWMFDVENGFIALFALIRWRANRDPARRRLFATIGGFACLYLLAAGFTNHVTFEKDFGSLADVLIGLPFLSLCWAASAAGARAATAADQPAPARSLRGASLVVHAASPLMLPATLLLLATVLLSHAPGFALAGFIVATLGYGLRAVLVQIGGMAEQDRLARLSHIDALTGLPNRRQFEQVLHGEWARAQRSGRPMAALLVDIDHFKRLNDGLGHLVGDDRLRDVAKALAGCATRGSDFVGRYGGEEFVAILPDTSREGALAFAEKMRAAVAARALPTPVPPGIVTISIGICWLDAVQAGTPEQMVAAADLALYGAKQAGRDRAEIGAFRTD